MQIILSESQIKILTEDRSLYLKQAYVNTNKIDHNTFDKIVDADPTKNKEFSEWLCQIWLYGNLKLEDLYKATEYLTIYYKVRHRLTGNQKNIYSLSNTKTVETEYINKKGNKAKKIVKLLEIDSLQDLFKIIQTYKDQDLDLTSNEKLDKETLVDETTNWKIYIPKTYEQSCSLGSGTEWCTATGKTRSYFDEYTTGEMADDLIIFVNKKNKKEKYQLHGLSKQFMDKNDTPVIIEEFFSTHLELAEWVIDNKKIQPEDIWRTILYDTTGSLFLKYKSIIQEGLKTNNTQLKTYLTNNAYKSDVIFNFCLKNNLFEQDKAEILTTLNTISNGKLGRDGDYSSVENNIFAFSNETKQELFKIFGNLNVSKIYEFENHMFYINKTFKVLSVNKSRIGLTSGFLKLITPDFLSLSSDPVFQEFLKKFQNKMLYGGDFIKLMCENEFFPRYYYSKSKKTFICKFEFNTYNGASNDFTFVIPKDEYDTTKATLIQSNLLDKYELESISKNNIYFAKFLNTRR